MQQKLIVEGKHDAIVVSILLEKRGNKPPLGYVDKIKYEEKFVKIAESIANVKKVLIEQLDTPDVERIGIIVDANESGFQNRIKMIDDIVALYGLQKNNDDEFTWNSAEGLNELKVSLWVMPDNKSNGYLEHFLYGIIPDKHNIAKEHASETVEKFYAKDEVNISNVKKQKAKTYAYLALMEKPGLPFGTAIEAQYFDAYHQNVVSLEEWFKQAFKLTE